MEKCPQCNTDRPQDEQGQYLAFCDECGHKFAASSEPQFPSPGCRWDILREFGRRMEKSDVLCRIPPCGPLNLESPL